MPVIKTKTNRVVADDPEPDDMFVRVVWFSSNPDGLRGKPIETPPQPIEEYQQAMDWAVSMADAMAHSIFVMPLRFRDIYPPEKLQRLWDQMTEVEREDLRRVVVTSCAKTMRDSHDRKLREAAYGILVDMGVVDQ
jgi:hypothetical protein